MSKLTEDESEHLEEMINEVRRGVLDSSNIHEYVEFLLEEIVKQEQKRIVKSLGKLKKPNYRVGEVNETIYWSNDVISVIKNIKW